MQDCTTLAHVHKRAGGRDRAIALFQQALTLAPPQALLERRLAESYLAEALKAQGNLGAAEQVLRDALTTRQQVIPIGNPEIAAVQVELATFLASRNEFQQAEPLMQSAYRILPMLKRTP